MFCYDSTLAVLPSRRHLVSTSSTKLVTWLALYYRQYGGTRIWECNHGLTLFVLTWANFGLGEVSFERGRFNAARSAHRLSHKTLLETYKYMKSASAFCRFFLYFGHSYYYISKQSLWTMSRAGCIEPSSFAWDLAQSKICSYKDKQRQRANPCFGPDCVGIQRAALPVSTPLNPFTSCLNPPLVTTSIFINICTAYNMRYPTEERIKIQYKETGLGRQETRRKIFRLHDRTAGTDSRDVFSIIQLWKFQILWFSFHLFGNTVLSPYVLTGRDRRVTRIVNSDPNSECSFLASFWPKGGARWNACVRDGRARWSRAVTLPTGTASQNLDAGPAQVFFAPQAILSNYTLYYNTFIRIYWWPYSEFLFVV